MTEKAPKKRETEIKKSRGSRKNCRKRRAAMIILGVLLSILAILIVVAVMVWNHTKPDPMSGQEPNFDVNVEETEDGEALDETPAPDAPTLDKEAMEETLPTVEDVELSRDEGWVHYLLLGVDGNGYKGVRSDAMIVFSINRDDKRLVLSSIPRDTLVYVDGKGFDKLTHAYKYGGADLTAKTFSQNFDIDVENYFIVNFQSLPAIVDAVGGVVLTLTEKEAFHMGEQYAAWGLSSGTQRLNGKEVLAYCRVRKIDSDYKRIERQYNALMAIYDEVKDLSYDKYIGLAKVAYESMYSDMKLGDMLLLVKEVMDIAAESEIENIKIVDRDNSGTASLKLSEKGRYSSYVVADDLAEAAARWREQLGIEGYEPSARVTQINGQLDKIVGR